MVARHVGSIAQERVVCGAWAPGSDLPVAPTMWVKAGAAGRRAGTEAERLPILCQRVLRSSIIVNPQGARLYVRMAREADRWTRQWLL